MHIRGTIVDSAPGFALSAGAGAAAGLGALSVSLIDQIVVLGVGAVLPLALGGPAWWWAGSAAAVLGSFLAPAGWAALGVLPFAAVTVAATARCIRRAAPRPWSLEAASSVLASAYAVVAAGALATSRAGRELAGLGEPIVELTAVHYLFAGTAALTLAGDALAQATGRRAAQAAVLLTAAAPPVVAVGFVTGEALPQVGGAVLMAGGVFVTAALQLRASVRAGGAVARSALLAVSGLAVWIPMALALAWAAGQHWPVPALSIPDMARTHGLPNALAFVLCGLLGRSATP